MNERVTPFDHAIAATLRRLRSEAGHSQPTVARYLGIRYQSYQDMEAGRNSFRASTLSKLAQFYGVDYGTLVDDKAMECPSFSNARELGTIAAMLVTMDKKMAEQAVREVMALNRRV